MKDEIKEILDSIQEHLKEKEENFKKGAVDSTVYYLYCDNARTLSDYITNLQEELERQSKAQVILDNQNAELYNKLTNLEEERDKFKLRCYKALKILLLGFDTQQTIFKAIKILQGEDKE